MKNHHIELTNCYEQRKRTFETFNDQCREIIAHLRKKRKQGSGIDIEPLPVTADAHDPNMLVRLIVVTNTAAKKYLLIKIRCDAQILYWIDDLSDVFRSAQQLYTSSAFKRTLQTLSPGRIIELEKFSENPFYPLEAMAALVA